MGDPDLLNEGGVAIIGSRKCSRYGSEVAKSLGKAAAESGITVISGGAQGIDSVALNAALESGGDDAAVNAAEDAHGRWQVRAGYLADGNAEAGTSYALDEMHDPAKAETIVRAYLSRYGRAFAARAGRAPTAEELARIHNGGPRGAESPRTLAYAAAFAATEGGRP